MSAMLAVGLAVVLVGWLLLIALSRPDPNHLFALRMTQWLAESEALSKTYLDKSDSEQAFNHERMAPPKIAS